MQRRLDLVYSVARRQCGGDAHLAEEVTQRVFAYPARKAAPVGLAANVAAGALVAEFLPQAWGWRGF